MTDEKRVAVDIGMLYRLICALAMELGVDPEMLLDAYVKESAGAYALQFGDLATAWSRHHIEPKAKA